MFASKDIDSKKTLAIYWRYTMKYKWLFAFGVFGAITATIIQTIIPPLIIAKLFEKLQVAYQQNHDLSLSAFIPYIVWFAITMFAGFVLWRLQGFTVWIFEIKVRRDAANDIYDHMQSQSMRFHADRFGGALVSQTNKFLGSYERLMDDFIWNILPGVTTAIVAIGVLFFLSWQFAVILLVISLIYLVIMWRRIRKQMPYNIAEAQADSRQTAALADSITNMSTIRAFAGEKYESKRFRTYSDKTYKAYYKLSIEAFKTDALSHAQTNGFQVLSLIIGLIAVTQYNVNVALLYLIISYTQSIVNRLWEFGHIVRNVNRSFGDAYEMTQILNVNPEVVDPIKPEKAKMERGEIRFNDVCFAYPENTEQALFKDLNIRIKPGEKVGLVGPSGGGKTTITSLLLRFMDIDNGAITIDGQNIANVKMSDLRQHITYVAQEPILFHRTLAENIGYGEANADIKAAQAAAKMANAHDFISRLPDGYETLVGERGVKLSGGQRQRVAIARAMLKNAPILVLDEATSALDSESEVLIQDALWRLMEGKTAVVIAHRLSTIQHMDRIIVLSNGKVQEEGSHKELLASNGLYSKLWAHQSGGFLD